MKGLSRKILARDIGIQNFAVNLIVLMEASINRGVRVFYWIYFYPYLCFKIIRMKRLSVLIFGVTALFLSSCSEQKEEEKVTDEFFKKKEKEVVLPFEQQVVREVEGRLSIPRNEKYTYEVNKAFLNPDNEEDAIITVNRYNFALEEASRSSNPAKNAEMGYIGNYNFFIYYDGKLKKFSNPVKVPSSPKAPLKVIFENIQSEVYKDITIEYRIANGNIQIMFQWKLFDNVGTAYPEANFITYDKGSMSLFKDIFIYTGKIKNYSPAISDVYTYNPEIEKGGGLQYRFFYDPRSLKYMTRE
jgi:hypothetical protein